MQIKLKLAPKNSEERAHLPIAKRKANIISQLDKRQVVLISGGTGCGKSTQVPQYILDDMWSKGKTCKIVCSQPRRISATSVADRIARERGEELGATVGYKIRMDGRGGKQSSIMFCTTGVLLRLLIANGAITSENNTANSSAKNPLSQLTHVIMDEIHERDKLSDFMLAILRDLLPSYPHLKLVLMSATVDAERFVAYFSGCQVIHVPGICYEVQSLYLEDVLSMLNPADNGKSPFTEELRANLNSLLSSNEESGVKQLRDFLLKHKKCPEVFNYQHPLTGVSPLMVFAGAGKMDYVKFVLYYGADLSLEDSKGLSAVNYANSNNQIDVSKLLGQDESSIRPKSGENLQKKERLETTKAEKTNELIPKLLEKICSDSEEGAILVFLPSWDNIMHIEERLLHSPFFVDRSKFLIYCLHSKVPSRDQEKVLSEPGPGVRKIILATNIAETAITINDLVFVIDTGHVKQKGYDPYQGVSTLTTSWISKASADQRMGRCGRCQPGFCYRLYTKSLFESFPEFNDPEIRCLPIEDLCLHVKLLFPKCKISEFFATTLDPPHVASIQNGISFLQEIGAIDLDEQLTCLGKAIGSLPVQPSNGRMLIYSVLMNCLGPALTLTCAAEYRDPFIMPVEQAKKKEAANAKQELACLYGGSCDRLAIVAAYDIWRECGSEALASEFCKEYFISEDTMVKLYSLRNFVRKELERVIYVPEEDGTCYGIDIGHSGVLQMVLATGTFPKVGRVLIDRKSSKTVVETSKVNAIILQSAKNKSSLCESAARPFIMYHEISLGDSGFQIKEYSVLDSHSLMLISKNLVVRNKHESVEYATSQELREGSCTPDSPVVIIVDGRFRFYTDARHAYDTFFLRERLSAAISFMVTFPQRPLSRVLVASMDAITRISSFSYQLASLSWNPQVLKNVGLWFASRPVDEDGWWGPLCLYQDQGRRPSVASSIHMSYFGTQKNVLFTNQMYVMVDDPSSKPFVFWSPDGDSILVRTELEFGRDVLPLYFSHSSCYKFVLELSANGFEFRFLGRDLLQIAKEGVFKGSCHSRSLLVKTPSPACSSLEPLIKYVTDDGEHPDFYEHVLLYCINGGRYQKVGQHFKLEMDGVVQVWHSHGRDVLDEEDVTGKDETEGESHWYAPEFRR